MRGGRLRRRVTIQQIASLTKTAAGEDVPVWDEFATTWADVLPQDGRQFVAADGQHARVPMQVKIRYMVGVTRRMRLVLGARVIELESVTDLEERHREMLLSGYEVT